MDIDKLEAGRELDALVAERVMGWRWRPVIGRSEWLLDSPQECAKCNPDYVRESVSESERYYGRAGWDGKYPNYSTDIANAWWVVEKLHELFPESTLDVGWSADTEQWFCQDLDGMTFTAGATTAPLAICRAALKAKGAGDA